MLWLSALHNRNASLHLPPILPSPVFSNKRQSQVLARQACPWRKIQGRRNRRPALLDRWSNKATVFLTLHLLSRYPNHLPSLSDKHKHSTSERPPQTSSIPSGLAPGSRNPNQAVFQQVFKGAKIAAHLTRMQRKSSGEALRDPRVLGDGSAGTLRGLMQPNDSPTGGLRSPTTSSGRVSPSGFRMRGNTSSGELVFSRHTQHRGRGSRIRWDLSFSIMPGLPCQEVKK